MATDSIASVSLLVDSNSVTTGANRTRISRGEIVLERQTLPSEDEGSSQQVEISHETLDKVVSQLKIYAQNLKRDLQFSVDENTGHVVVNVLDSETHEVIRQIPPEELLALAQHLAESFENPSTGFLLQTKV